ncbi:MULTISPECIES: FMN-binding protein [unclassified Candidatus Frackibacter]|uniref:FMN-binding protein n=1 Tax=unclassified Candidatus Frackibacter TaxID=2648818 RepID=UPI000799FF7E|nr:MULTISPECIES: FMN-binding protein [unclassified Candidatus Frackibacter]KXS43438.1 MAG: hypothetical protein AWU54_1019 [Candidatus Frackibacter sp. T328-2]SDC57119.1 4Fe-4S dicluster domain-containing protein [Candidatus Frackibacter sp. WG11]SEM71275.1 4Fe-4S dicluster domain-containing protein [Candidatus Frackibacter sp. WG12]SFL83025.1 4Fe-4S dicluster domain-containing protein [Candidatus Frackibacter sp. WG13]
MERYLTRPVRLTIFTSLLALVFPAARLLLVGLLIGIALWKGIKELKAGNQNKSYAYLSIVIIFLLLTGYTFYSAHQVRTALQNVELDISQVKDGQYQGQGEGKRGLIKVAVEVNEGEVTEIKILEESETPSIGGVAMNKLKNQILKKQAVEVDSISGATLSSNGFKAAVSKALWEGMPKKPEVSGLAKVMYFLLENNLNKVTFNSLAILFIILMMVDYTIHAILAKDTGQSLNCMNCQTCVGACPVKIADGDPFPMTMVLEARLGNYERVEELAPYCVGCSKCSGKCPAGISAPSVAGSSIKLLNKKRQEEAAKERDVVKDRDIIQDESIDQTVVTTDQGVSVEG